MASVTMTGRAREMGRSAAAHYNDTFGRIPADDDPDFADEKAADAWTRDVVAMKAAGMTMTDFDACSLAWDQGFWVDSWVAA